MDLDLAAIAPTDSAMPFGFELTNGAYLPVERVVTIDPNVQFDRSMIRHAYEAAYERHLSDEFMEVEIIAFASPNAATPSLTLGRDTIGQIAVWNQVDADLQTDRLVRPNQVVAGLAVAPEDRESAFPVCAVAYTADPLLVRAIWHSTSLASGNWISHRLAETERVAFATRHRAEVLINRRPIPGVDQELPGIAPVFDPPANFENYLHSAGRYERPALPGIGFVSGYRRGVTEDWTTRGRRRRLIACDLLRFDTAESAAHALANPRTLLSEQMLEHTLIPADPDLTNALVYGEQMSSGYWVCTTFVQVRDLVVTADVWGYESLLEAEAIAARIVRNLQTTARIGNWPTTLGPDF